VPRCAGIAVLSARPSSCVDSVRRSWSSDRDLRADGREREVRMCPRGVYLGARRSPSVASLVRRWHPLACTCRQPRLQLLCMPHAPYLHHPTASLSSFRSLCLHSATTCVFIPQPLSLFRSNLCLHSATTVFIPQPLPSLRSHCLYSAATCVFIP